MEDNAHDWPAPRMRLRASPLVRRLAAERGLDLRGVDGSGPGGRIVERDLDRTGGNGGTDLAAPDLQDGAAARHRSDEPPRRHATDGKEVHPQPAGDTGGDAHRAAGPAGAGSVADAAARDTKGRGAGVVTLHRSVPVARLAMLQEVVGERYGPVPLWAFVARALLLQGHGPIAVARGFAPPCRLDAAASDPVTALEGRLGAVGAASCVVVDLSPEALSGGALPLPEEADLQVVLGAPQDDRRPTVIDMGVTSRAGAPEQVAAILRALTDAVARPGALLSNLPEV